MSSTPTSITEVSKENPITKTKTTIICYGDSLTAGTSPPFIELFPYGPHLEAALKQQQEEEQNKETTLSNVDVKWFGLPGWTASSMLKHIDNKFDDGDVGLRSILKRMHQEGSKVSLVILMAGTNDLAFHANDDDGSVIAKSIIGLHNVVHNENIPTIAISIPPSKWQSQSDSARSLALSVNEKLRHWCDEESRSGMAQYVLCPIEEYSREDGLWSFDGLHFSPAGFRAFGERLAPHVSAILSKLGIV